MRLLVSGSTGLIGSALVAARRAGGDEVVPLSRRGAAGTITWDALDPAVVSGFDAVVHLAGEPLADGRWTAAKKAAIRDSRVGGTAKLAAALAAAPRPPGVFICASGINYYGDRGDAVVDESAPAGRSFLADVCVAWEAAAAPLVAVGCRVVHLRMGMVLSASGAPLAAMVTPFRLGLGGPVAGGGIYVSWVTLADVARGFGYAVDTPAMSGAYNLVAPEPVTNRAFTRALASAVRRPAVLPVPGWLVRLAFGELANETALTSIRAVPRRLTEAGFGFRDDRVGPALAGLLRRQ